MENREFTSPVRGLPGRPAVPSPARCGTQKNGLQTALLPGMLHSTMLYPPYSIESMGSLGSAGYFGVVLHAAHYWSLSRDSGLQGTNGGCGRTERYERYCDLFISLWRGGGGPNSRWPAAFYLRYLRPASLGSWYGVSVINCEEKCHEGATVPPPDASAPSFRAIAADLRTSQICGHRRFAVIADLRTSRQARTPDSGNPGSGDTGASTRDFQQSRKSALEPRGSIADSIVVVRRCFDLKG